MKQFLIFLTSLFLFVVPAIAQNSMTDDQILEYLIAEHKKGTSQQEMATDLLKKGVTTSQLQRVRRKAEKMRKNGNQVKESIAETRAEEIGITNKDESSETSNIEEVATIEEADQRQVFGRNIFNTRNLTFQPSNNLSTPVNYIMGVGDLITINIWGASQQTIEARISADGYVVINEVGPIKLVGLSIEKAKNVLRSKLGQFYNDCDIDLSLTDTRSIQIQVMGEVKSPGTYTISGLSTAFNALYRAGGINRLGTLRDIKVYRRGKVISTIDVYDYILNGNTEGDVRLEDNDIIVVGTYDCLVQIKGNVKRPMWYEMKKSETVADLLRYSGSYTSNAYTKKLRLTRKAGDEYSIHTIDEFQLANFTVSDEDLVEIDSIRNRFQNRVEIRGAVKYPGHFELGKDVNSVRSLILAAEGLSENAYEGRAIMHREKDDLTLEMIGIDVHGIISGTVSDIPLRKNDVVFIPNKTDMLGDLSFNVWGMVAYPGTYPYADNTTLQDIIIQAGGLLRGASYANVNVYRRVYDKTKTTELEIYTENFSFTLDHNFKIIEDTTFILQPHDIVIVRKNPTYHEQQVVQVLGEVLFPGRQYITKKDFHLSDLIKACGGTTKMANLRGAKLTRLMTPEELEQRDHANLQAQIQLYEDGLKEGKELNMQIADSLLSLKENTSKTYNIAINLEQALLNPGGMYDIRLREGDEINIPQLFNVIRISGEVMHPVAMTYEKGRNLNYYIQHAGGYTTKASKRKIYGINTNGSVVKLGSNSIKSIEPGMEIVVPQKKYKRATSTSEIIGISSGVAALGSIIVALLNVVKSN